MKTTTGSLPLKSGSSSFQSNAQSTAVDVVRLLALGACAVALHAAMRHRVEWGPGHQGLTWMALVMGGRITSHQRWAALTTAVGAAAATMLPVWHLGDPFLWLAYATAGGVVDLAFHGFVRSSRAVWPLALIGGVAHATKPVLRAAIAQSGGWQYESLLRGLPFPVASHFFFGAVGALIGVGVVRLVNRRRSHD